MKTSAAGRDAISAREGRRLVAYKDAVGVRTIGVGHTGRMSPPKVTPGMRITDAQCDAFLAADLGPVEAVINSRVTVPITQNEFDAMASLGFNIGIAGLGRSSVVRKLNLGDVSGAAKAFMDWSKPAVLIERRKAETAQFLTPDAPTRDNASPMKHVAAARSNALAAKAKTVRTNAHRDGVAALAVGTIGAATATALPVTHAGHPILTGVAILAGLTVVAAVVLAVAGHRKAAVLSAAADRQALAARGDGVTAPELVEPLAH